MNQDWDPQGRQAWDDPLGTWDRLRTTAPVAFSSQGRRGDGRFWSLSRFDDITAAARDTTTFVNTGGSRFGLAGEVTYEPWHRFGPRTLPVWITPA